MLSVVANARMARHWRVSGPGDMGVHGVDFVLVGERLRCSFAILSEIFGLICFLFDAADLCVIGVLEGFNLK